jgi:hypothetical protein
MRPELDFFFRAFYWREMIYWCRTRTHGPTPQGGGDLEMLGSKRAPANFDDRNSEDLDTLNGMVKRCRCNDDIAPQGP